jgi:photosystem II stability/assembly factor-like uncharacterized protein
VLRWRGLTAFAVLTVVAAAVVAGAFHPSAAKAEHWQGESLPGSTRIAGEVPLSVSHGIAQYVGRHDPKSRLTLNFGFPLRSKAQIDALVRAQAKTHSYLSHEEVYALFSPPQTQMDAAIAWLKGNGFRITHISRDRLAVAASATTATIERTLQTRIDDYIRPGTTYRGMKVKAYSFFANTSNPLVPARLGLQTISGLTNVDRFYTAVQLASAKALATTGCGEEGPVNPLCVDVRSGGYFPADIRSLYDVSGHGFDGTGQTLGFTLWTAAERQPAMTAFATATGDTPITVDPSCVATGNSPTTPSSCTTQVVAGDHLMTILENGNADNNFGSNVETALDIEQAHGIATHAALKYYASECSSTTAPGSGLTNAGCNGTDVGLEEAVEDAANDPTLHTISNSWGYGGDAEWGASDPFVLATGNSFAIAALAGTTFWFSTGDSGTYQSGYPADSPYVVSVGGTTLFSTANTAQLSTETTWTGGGSWCSNVMPRPSWQTGSGVAANAPCPGRTVPDVSAVADTASSVRFVSSRDANGGTQSGGVGGTSVAAPELNGFEAVTLNFLAAQSYSGSTPSAPFMGPAIYDLGNSANRDSYYRDILCGNTANPTSGPDGDAALPGWDAATGWGAPDWFAWSTGLAIQLGAQGLSQPPSLAAHYAWTCARTPGNSSERSISFPTASTGYAVGAASGATPWYGKFLPAATWGAVNTFYKSTDGGQTWYPSNGDMTSIACSSSTACVEVGDGGRIKTTADGGITWADTATPFNKALTQVQCPSASVCYAAGDRGTVLKSTDGGTSWSYLQSSDGNPVYGLSCPSASTCYATDIYAHVVKTIDGGSSWTWQQTPITTPGANVAPSGGPNPFAGLLSISCSDVSTCVATGLYVVPAGQTIPSTDPPILTTTDGGATWVRQISNAGSGNYLHAVSCLPGTTTCTAVGRAGKIVTTTDLATWTPATSNATGLLNAVTCLGASFCVAVGQNGTVDTWNGATWAAKTGVGGTGMLASVTCVSTTTCYAAGKQGVTVVTNDGGATWTQQAGGGTTQQMNGVSCPTASTCFGVGNSGTILATTNGGQSWLPQASGTTSNLNGVSCTSTTSCVAVGTASGVAPNTVGTIRRTTDGSTWTTVASPVGQTLTGVSCAVTCVAVGAAGTVIASSDGGGTWAAQTSGVTTALNAITCNVGACYAAGAVAGGSAVLLRSIDGGTTWAPQASNSAQALSAVACVDALNCFAGGAIGTVVSTNDGGVTWRQQGNPLSGPTTALNVTASANVGANALACSAVRCIAGTGSSGNIMTTPLLTVTVHSSSFYGSTPSISLAANDPAITVSPASEAGHLTGTLTCSTTATATSDAGPYPVSACGGLADAGFSVVYDYPGSNHTVLAAPQTISFDPLPPATYGDPDFTVGATATSGLPVSFAASGDCTVSGPTVHITGAGSCSITASQGGALDWQAAPDVTRTFAIAKAGQTITFSGPANQTFGDPDFTVDATATSRLPVSLAVDFGPCTLSSTIAPAQVHLHGAGACTIRASQAGDANWDAAPDETRSFSIAMANQTIAFGPLGDKTFGDPDFTVSATASSGLDVSFAAAGNCTVSGATVHIAGAGSCSITASQPGNGDWNPAPDVTQSFAIADASQTITFAPIPDHTWGDADFAVAPSASSGLPVSLAVGDGSACTVSGFTVHLTGAGSCSLTASQAGDADHEAAPSVTRAFTIAKASQTIAFAAIPDHTWGDADFAVAPAATSGLPVSPAVVSGSTCTLIGTTVHITGAGSCSITASQAGNSNYEAAPSVTRTFTIAKAAQTITFAAIPDRTFGSPDFEIDAFATSRLPVAFAASGPCTLSSPTSPSNVHPTGLGTCTVTATQGGDGNWDAAPGVTRSFKVVNSTHGLVDGEGLEPAVGGDAVFHVLATKAGPVGTLVYDGPKPKRGKALHLESTHVTAIGIAADGKSAWFAGTSRDGKSFLAYAEDNQLLRSRKGRDLDVFKLWIDGVAQTGDGSLDSGLVTILR